MKYIFDVDNTILAVDNSDYENAKPIQERIDFVNRLYDLDNTIVYWTARGARSGIDWHQFTLLQLLKFGAKFHQFYTKKPHYDVWVDDKAVNATDFFKSNKELYGKVY